MKNEQMAESILDLKKKNLEKWEQNLEKIERITEMRSELKKFHLKLISVEQVKVNYSKSDLMSLSQCKIILFIWQDNV